MYHSQTNEASYTIERLGQELQDLKRKYYEEKRKEQANKLRSDTPEILPNKNRINAPGRTAGGGFFMGSKLEQQVPPITQMQQTQHSNTMSKESVTS